MYKSPYILTMACWYTTSVRSRERVWGSVSRKWGLAMTWIMCVGGYVCVCMCVCVYVVRVSVYMCVRVCVCVHVVRVSVCMCVHIYVCVCMW
jgi:hypothetical protein